MINSVNNHNVASISERRKNLICLSSQIKSITSINQLKTTDNVDAKYDINTSRMYTVFGDLKFSVIIAEF